MIRGVLLDLAGVLYDGDRAIDGAPDAVARLAGAGLPVRFVTNSTRAPRRVLLQRLHNMGFAIDADQLFTPARAACDLLRQNGRAPHLLIHPDLAEDFTDLPTLGPDKFVVIGDATEHFTYDAMNAAFRALSRGADLLALAANRHFRDADGGLSIDVGAFVAALDAVMVGDDAEADVAGALKAGLGHAVLVQTGKYRPGDERRAPPGPATSPPIWPLRWIGCWPARQRKTPPKVTLQRGFLMETLLGISPPDGPHPCIRSRRSR